MNNSRLEIVVGLFLVLGFAAFGWLALQLGEVSWLGEGSTYTLYAEFENVSGVKAGAEVQIAGVTVGSVTELRLGKDDFAIATLKLDKDIRLAKDSMASVKSQGIIGDKLIQITPGGDEEMYQAGDVIVDTESSVDLESLISKFAFGGVK
ncbi:outer membrane lipid asymmetry maintenance protein MlaD [Desulfobulbus sp. US2]|uniref:Phospholipid/cholesterol/gamma-HCH transport system substrate-binding protein n=1 Tax=Candidatus Electrothrix communis TaxID=1859133 RepID=A0A444J9A1_9BACT|nr:outer membrane lipid asymmetry maintenance protein MlaD [Desulfobulbus sp. US4]MCW5207168.1 outer membrane lipid asymmetry maintenance protein MlaD [Desulfobulbus sp. US2]MCW5210472.1 outer membrane lipid asymmetry maintenance protein MlaD [Desulfobulbus sp. N3]MCW5213831.1 outer membrane lipid asymmetry maintenance protein MlaD [Desulfobulbus sp. US5]RWX49632.1 phospholipid/cholesterol/gamma-HCH transport system substrate-binding protein [Candidatus Electrothrix communis]